MLSCSVDLKPQSVCVFILNIHCGGEWSLRFIEQVDYFLFLIVNKEDTEGRGRWLSRDRRVRARVWERKREIERERASCPAESAAMSTSSAFNDEKGGSSTAAEPEYGHDPASGGIFSSDYKRWESHFHALFFIIIIISCHLNDPGGGGCGGWRRCEMMAASCCQIDIPCLPTGFRKLENIFLIINTRWTIQSRWLRVVSPEPACCHGYREALSLLGLASPWFHPNARIRLVC